MWKRVVLMLGVLALVVIGCGSDEEPKAPVASCFDGVQNGDEEDVDCGGSCDACEAEPTCRDGVQNGDEEGVDCGGVCQACEVAATCDDGEQNGDEEGVDCGGTCDPCGPAPTCDDGVQNGDEEGVDCGGVCAACEPAATCDDGVQNGNEEGVDCGGSCDRCREPVPGGWLCPADSYDDLQCDCGCGVVDEDCSGSSADVCVASACPADQRIDPSDNSSCIDYPEGPENPSFETTPGQAGDIPGWTIVRKDGISDVTVVGPAQTTAPDGSRALFLTSTYRFDGGMSGFPSPVEVESTPFIPAGTQCDLTIAMGDVNTVNGNSEYGLISVLDPGAPAPLDLLAQVSIDTRGNANSIEPTEDTYQDIVLSFSHDGMSPLVVNILADANFSTLAFHVDHIRLDCL